MRCRESTKAEEKNINKLLHVIKKGGAIDATDKEETSLILPQRLLFTTHQAITGPKFHSESQREDGKSTII